MMKTIRRCGNWTHPRRPSRANRHHSIKSSVNAQYCINNGFIVRYQQYLITNSLLKFLRLFAVFSNPRSEGRSDSSVMK